MHPLITIKPLGSPRRIGPRSLLLGLLAASASLLVPTTALGYSSSTRLAGDGSYAAMSDDHSIIVGCDTDKDGHKAYLRRYDIWGGLYPTVYDPDGAGGACAVVAVNDWPLGSYNICVQGEGCARPVPRSEFDVAAPESAPDSPDTEFPEPPTGEAQAASVCPSLHISTITNWKNPGFRTTMYVCRSMTKRMWRVLKKSNDSELVANTACRLITRLLPGPWKLVGSLCRPWVRYRLKSFKKHLRAAATNGKCFTWTMEKRLTSGLTIDHVGSSRHKSYCKT